MLTTNLRGGVGDLMNTPYLNTTGACMELFFWMVNDQGSPQPTIQVFATNEELYKAEVASVTEQVLPGWNRLYFPLPDGLNRIEILTIRPHVGTTGVGFDDISVKQCSLFG